VKDRSDLRSIGAGKKATGHAFLFPEPDKGGRGKKSVQRLNNFSKASLSNARIFLAHSQALATKVRRQNLAQRSL
jgi:hypothetical protein